MWDELGISGGTAIVVLVVGYFVVKWAVKNGVKEAYKDITGEETFSEREFSRLMNGSEDKNDNQEV